MTSAAAIQAPRSVGCVGVGRMGGPMALNLLRAGLAVTAYDTAEAQVAALVDAGATAAPTLADAARGVDVVVTMLPNDDALIAVVEGANGLLEQLTAGQVLIDMSTSKLATTQRLAALLADKGVAMLDAPVSGGEVGARDGTLSIMVGGERAQFERCQGLLSAMGSKVTYIGANGMGIVAKLVNQLLMEASFCAVAEGFALAAKAGADPDAVFAAVAGGLGGSRVLDWMYGQLRAGDMGTGRELTLHYKDGSYALAAAATLGSWAPVTELTHQIFEQAMHAGYGHESAGAVARVYEQRVGVTLVGMEPTAATHQD
jgi:3-hydroxyisobutyrate dehydrogenase-like beta-hydroxyacid dehydrogenase